MCGWIQLHRSLKDWEWFTDVNTSHLFIYCLLRANHKATKWRGIDIPRGGFITSLDTISVETGLSVMQVRTAIKKLEKTSEVTSKATSKNRLITVTNYNTYQDDNKPVNKRATNKQQADNKQVTTDNNENNNNNENKVGGRTPLSPKPKKNLGSRLPEDWSIPDEYGDWCVNEFGWNADRVIKTGEVFKDFWLAKSGKDAVKLDWLATWRNWCRRDNKGDF